MKKLVVPPPILLIGNDAVGDQVLAALAEPYCGSFSVERVSRLSDGLEFLCKKEVSAVLLELSLPDCEGIDTFDKLFTAAAHTPILILGNQANEAMARRAVERGAHDYLLATHIDGYSLPRALRNAIEQQAIEDASYTEKERALVTINSIGDGVLYTDIAGNVAYLNLVAETMTGWSREEAVGQPLAKVFRIIDGTTRKTASDPLEMAVEQNRPVGLTMNCIL